MTRRPGRHDPSIGDSLREYGRGIAGGFLFSLPLLATMEIWVAGATVTPARLLAGLCATFVLLCGFNAYAGLRYDANWREVMVDSVEELGIGLLLGAFILLLLGRLGPAAGITEIVGLVVLEGLFVAVGVSVGTAQLSGSGGRDRGMPMGRQQTVWSEIVLASCGAVLVAANMAPTEEVLRLSAEMLPWQLLAVVAVSLLLAATLLFYSEFTGSARFAEIRGLFGVIHGSAITYAAALAMSAGMLWFFGRFEHHPVTLNVAQCVVLGFGATVGASAGRLLLR